MVQAPRAAGNATEWRVLMVGRVGVPGPKPIPSPDTRSKERLLENFEREYIGQPLKRCEGNIARAARESRLHRKSTERLVKKYQLDPGRCDPGRARVP